MRTKNISIFIVVLIVAAIAGFTMMKHKNKTAGSEVVREIHPVRGTLQTYISTTGTVLPKNRLRVKPQVNGRIETIEVAEGDKVKDGQVLAWMSSTERAALLDAAEGRGEEELKYWREVYKPIAVLSPIDGEVIVATTQPGQTLTTGDDVVVLSDHLIVRAQVDETDIGKIGIGQEAVVTLDSYPDTKIKTVVEHIYYESQTVNNVTIYNVDLLPENVPPFFRSGMNASIDFKQALIDNALLLPVEAVYKQKDGAFVLVKRAGTSEPVKEPVVLGGTDDKSYQIVSGINENDPIIIKTKKYVLPTAKMGKNPFMPFSGKQKKSGPPPGP